MPKYIMNIKTGKIHDGEVPCSACRNMGEANKKFFDKYSEAESFFEGDTIKGVFCAKCFKIKPED